MKNVIFESVIFYQSDLVLGVFGTSFWRKKYFFSKQECPNFQLWSFSCFQKLSSGEFVLYPNRKSMTKLRAWYFWQKYDFFLPSFEILLEFFFQNYGFLSILNFILKNFIGLGRFLAKKWRFFLKNIFTVIENWNFFCSNILINGSILLNTS